MLLNYFILAVLLACTKIVVAATNITIDDVSGDPVNGLQVQYLPAHPDADPGGTFWKNQDQCTPEVCAILPSVDQAFNQTWTQATYFEKFKNMSIGFSFEGSALYVYFILTNEPRNTSLVSDVFCDFRLDGEIVGSYKHLTDETNQTIYNVMVFDAVGLSHDNHTMLIETTGTQSSLVIFDRAIYTTFDSDGGNSPPPAASPSPTTKSSSLSAGVIAGSVIGAIAGLLVIIFGVILFHRRRASRRILIVDDIHPRAFPVALARNFSKGSESPKESYFSSSGLEAVSVASTPAIQSQLDTHYPPPSSQNVESIPYSSTGSGYLLSTPCERPLPDPSGMLNKRQVIDAFERVSSRVQVVHEDSGLPAIVPQVEELPPRYHSLPAQSSP